MAPSSGEQKAPDGGARPHSKQCYCLLWYVHGINYGQQWFISNVPWQRMQLIRFYKTCTIEISYEERCYYGTFFIPAFIQVKTLITIQF